MKVWIIYKSIHHGNTKKVLDVMAKELKKKHNVQMHEVSKADKSLIKKSDLIIFGSGIYYSKHHKDLLDFVDKLPKHKSKKAVIVSTSGFASTKFHKSLKKKLIAKGFKVVDEFNCKGWDTFGPFKVFGGLNKGRPNKQDFKDARIFIQLLHKSL